MNTLLDSAFKENTYRKFELETAAKDHEPVYDFPKPIH